MAITLVNRDDQHSIRVRNYEDELDQTLVPLRSVLDPIGVELVVGDVTGVDLAGRCVQVDRAGQAHELRYDKLVLASGSARAGTP